ncbi:MAG TPA: Ig-like domain-containing protein, partial [Opitutus sp.]|nr:Ig-like domain-containing protein [Opitutus sp.]
MRQNLFRRLLAAAAFCLGSAVSAVAQGASVQVTQITTSDGGPFDNLPGQVFQHDLGSPITFSAVVAGFPATAADMSPANVISVIEDGVVVRLLSSDGGFPNDSHADVDYSPVSPGPKTYVVSATNGTTTVTSVPIRVNVYGISISAPVDGGAAPVSSDLFISGPTLVRNGVVGTVQFYANGIRIGADSNAPYAVAWHPTVAGAYALTARVTASDGSTSDSPPVSFTVVPAAANGTIVVNITNPAAGATVAAGTSVTVAADARVTGSAGSISQVQFYLDGMPLDTPKTAFPFTTTWSPAVAGTYSLTAIATDDKGNARAAPGVAVTVTGNFPAVELTSPANGGHVTSGSSVTLAATASGEDGSAASVRSVDFLVDGNLIGTTTVPPYAFAWAPTQPRAAPYSLVARATATNGSVVSSSPVSVTVTAGGGIAPPTVALSPGSLFSMPGGAYRLISVSATANAGRTVRTVELLVDGAVVAEDGSAPYNFLFRAPLSFGSHVLTARVTDSASIESENSVGLEITVPYGQAPTVTLQLPADGAQVDIGTDVNLSAVASDSDGTIQSVVFLANNDPVLVATAVPYAGQFFPQTAGTVTIAALATDNAGLTSLATKTITVGGQPQGTPAVTLTKPDADNAVVASGQRIVFEAVASAGSSDAFVSRVEFLVNGLPLGTDGSQVGFTNTYRVTDVFLVQPGTYTITARVTDSRGVSAESTNRQSITVKTPLGAAPTVSIVSPQAPSTGDLAFTNLSTIPLVAVAADADGAVTDVEFFVDRGQRAKATATLDTEKDKDGNVTRRFVSGVTVTQAGEGYLLIPKVAIDGDGAGASAVVATMTADKGVGDVTVVAGGSGYTAAAVRFIGGGLFEGQSIGHAVRDPGGLGWRLTMQPGQLGAGPYRLYAVARDTGGNQTISSTVRFVVTGATSLPPTVALTSNVTSTTSGQPVNLLASAFDPDGSIAAVEFFVNSTSLNKLTSGPFAQSWTPTSPGTYLVTAIATDDTGNATVSNTLTISVTGSPPTGLAPVVTILNPPGTLVVSRLSTYVFSAVAFDSDGEIASVEFYRDGVSIGTAVREEASGSYRFVYSFGGLALRPPPTPVSSGNPYKFLAVARDTTGNATTSVPVDVYVDTATSQQPVVSVGASVATVNFGQTVTLSANAVDPDGRITSIKFFANGAAVVPEITADASGSVSATTANWIPTSDGVYDVIALVRDNTGNYAVSAPTVVTVRTSTTLVDDPTFVAQTYQDLLDRTPTTPEAAAAAQITAGTL